MSTPPPSKVDKVVTVSERAIALAVLRLLESRNTLVEGGGAAGFAALLQPQLLPELQARPLPLFCVRSCFSAQPRH